MEEHNMSTFKHVEEWYQDNQDLVVKYVDDPELILTSENGNKKGVYLASVKMIVEEEILIPMYVGEAGGDEEHDRSISDRLKEHLRHWLGDYTEHYTGVKKSELESGKMKFHFSIVAESSDIEKRKKMEEERMQAIEDALEASKYGKDLRILYKEYPQMEEMILHLKDICLEIVSYQLMTLG